MLVSDGRSGELVDQLRRANAGLREVVAAKDAEFEALQRARDAETAELRAVVHALTLRVAELERRLGSGSDDSGTPTSKDSVAAKARRKAERRSRGEQGGSSRQRSVERSRGGQPGRVGRGLMRDPNPTRRVRLDPPAACRGCGTALTDAAEDAGTAWSQVWDVQVVRTRVEYLLPRRRCGCGAATTACPPDGGVVNSVSFGPMLNTAAVVLTAFGNVPTERAAVLVEILLGQPVSAGFIDRANTRLAGQLGRGGFEQAMRRALLAEPVLTADESPVEVVRPATDPDTAAPAGSPHVMVIRTPDERLLWLCGLVSRGYDVVIAGLRGFAGHLIVDGYGAYQRLRVQAGGLLAGIQQCVVHVLRRCRAVAKLGPGTLQSSWTGKLSSALTDAHTRVQAAKARGQTQLDPDVLAELRERYDRAVATGIIHNRHRGWDGGGNHPGYTLAVWLHDYADQVWHFTRHFQVDWSSNAAERGVKPAKRHQAVSGYWQTDQTLNRWCLIQSYLTSARNHGLTVLDAITRAMTARPWLPEPIKE